MMKASTNSIVVFILLFPLLFSLSTWAEEESLTTPPTVETAAPPTITPVASTELTALEEAIKIVLDQSEVIQAKNSSLGLARNSSNLTSKISLATGYSEKTTQEFAAGFDTRSRFTVEYPITFGTTSQTDKEKAAALADLYTTQESLRATFVKEIQGIAMLEMELQNTIQSHSFKVDILKRAKEANELALKEQRPLDQIDLKPLVEAALAAEQAAAKADRLFRLTLENTAIVYGKSQWRELQNLILKHIKSAGQSLALGKVAEQ
jgi:hypothetical protein